MKTIILSVLFSVLAASVVVQVAVPSSPALFSKQESVFERVTRTNTLRCGYGVATPWFYVDPNTQEKKGYAYDVTMAAAEKMGLKVEWVEETGWGVAEQGLITHRYDMMCGSVCIDPHRNRAAIYSIPFEHAPILPIARAGDKRFKNGIGSINDPSIRIGVKNGHVFEYIAKERFPKAQLVYANDLSDDSEFFIMLSTKKIDIAFSGKITADLYEEKNPRQIQVLPYAARYCDGAFMMPLGEFNLKQMVDNAILELSTAGKLEEIAKKYMPLAPLYIQLPARPPYN